MTALAICLIVWMSVLIIGGIDKVFNSFEESDALGGLIRCVICTAFIIAISIVML